MAGKEGTQRVGIEGPKTARTKCPNCHKNYRLTDGKNTSSKQEPLLLWCGHGVCEKCVSDSVYTCTICEKETKTDQELTKHCYIMGTVINERNEMLKMKFHSHWDEPHQMVQNKKDMCQECNKHKASVRCKICVSQLCRKCFKKIHSHRIMRSHIAEPLESLTPHYQPSSCPDHPDYTCSLLCNTCTLSGKEVFICRRCHVLGSHQQHDVTEMTSLVSNSVT
ncbi:hypothetical protein Pmani_020716 [Petrolisthes manimaculis]|uniref:RING-type domain-containing protein n=1 Tax=Petrolisthes manimaculis TaxID=1843537 RepID=A0AAE1PI03_9EUCA|nr:hypothetical protein Pmani_020716 [Petrolisthes manimaculis]